MPFDRTTVTIWQKPGNHRALPALDIGHCIDLLLAERSPPTATFHWKGRCSGRKMMSEWTPGALGHSLTVQCGCLASSLSRHAVHVGRCGQSLNKRIEVKDVLLLYNLQYISWISGKPTLWPCARLRPSHHQASKPHYIGISNTQQPTAHPTQHTGNFPIHLYHFHWWRQRVMAASRKSNWDIITPPSRGTIRDYYTPLEKTIVALRRMEVGKNR